MAINEANTKKPIYKKWWFWFFVVILIIIILVNSTNSQNIQSSSNGITDVSEENKSEATPTQSSATIGQKNALAKAKLYLATTAFSYTGLIHQLEYDSFSTEEATYGADNCGANWNEQATKKAKEYINITAFSKTELINQLEYEGFTTEQAEYGANSIGY